MRNWIVTSLILACFSISSKAEPKSAPMNAPTESAAKSGDQITAVQPVLTGGALKQALMYKRKAIFESAFELMQPDKDKFWNIYADYETEKAGLDENRIKMLQQYVKDFSTITAEQMNKSIDVWYDNQNTLLKIRKKYADRLRKEINPLVAGRFFQVDTFVSSAIQIGLLNNIPLLGDKFQRSGADSN